MIDNGELLESVVDHASQLDVDYDDIAPTVAALTGSGDVSLVPRLCEALDRFLDEENFYGRDLIAGVLAGVAGIAALPTLLLAADRDLGDDQDGLQSEIAVLLNADPVAGRESILELARSDAPERRRAGLLALGSVAEAGDAGTGYGPESRTPSVCSAARRQLRRCCSCSGTRMAGYAIRPTTRSV